MNLAATLFLDNRNFLKGLGGSLAGLGALTAGLALLKSSIDRAAEMETLTGSFTTLLGSAKAARERMKELADFAASTPFELPEIAAASRLLQAFTGTALSTGRGLTLVGDAAAAVGQPLEAVTMWMGRLFAALREGQSLGEPLQNLTQLGLISGPVRKQLMALQGTAQSTAQVMTVLESAFGRNAGAMERLSQTYAGKISTLKDGWASLQRAFAEPLIDALKPLLDRGTAQMSAMEAQAGRVGDEVAAWVGALSAGTLGEALGVSLLRGVARFSAELAQTMLVDVPGMVVAGIRAPFIYVVTEFKRLMFEALAEIGDQANRVLPERFEVDTASLRGRAGAGLSFGEILQQQLAENMRGQTNWADVVDAPLKRWMDEVLAPFRAAVARTRDLRQNPPESSATAPVAGASGAASQLAQIASDRFSKIGLFVGAGGEETDYARRTANGVERLHAALLATLRRPIATASPVLG